MTKEKLYKNRDWMYCHYIESEESMSAMAQKAVCSNTTIWRWLREFSIPTRTIGEAVFLVERNFLDLSDKLSDLLEGELLGDGCLALGSPRSVRYRHGSKYREYLVWLSKTFSDLGLKQAGKINKYWSKAGNAFDYNYASRSYSQLIPMRERWYPNGKKIVPKDLRLNPTISRQWFIGDGCLSNQAKRSPFIRFSTCAFDRASIDHLIDELMKQGFKATHQPARNVVYIFTKSVKDFLNWIGPCPIDCYSYKWNLERN